MEHTASLAEHIQRLYAAIEAGQPIDRFFHPDAEQIEYPSLMRPRGHRRPLAEMLEGAELGNTIMRDQRYVTVNAVEQGDQVAMQLTWTATTTVDLGALPAGTGLTAHIGLFAGFRDGLIIRFSSYDCYEPIKER